MTTSKPLVTTFFHAPTFTVSHVVADPQSKACAIIDPVLDFNLATARTSTTAADELIACVEQQGYDAARILETHAHADHLSAAPYLQEKLGGKISIGAGITSVQETFRDFYNAADIATDGSQFDHLFADDEVFEIGDVKCRVLHTPGHTPACVTYLIGDAAFVGDTLFMPDFGTARCDFPGGDAATLYRSIQRLYELDPSTRMFMCHDYLPDGRASYMFETTVAEQRMKNIHVHEKIDEAAFVARRAERDATLAAPALILPALQVNIRAGHLPPAEENGVAYLKMPLNKLGGGG